MKATIISLLILITCLSCGNQNNLTSREQQTNLQKEKQTMVSSKLIYFGDPMCSWCYGFSPEISKVIETMPEGVDFDLVMGGLRPYGTETMASLKDFLKSHWVEIGEKTGLPFKYEILEQADFLYDTEPACRAVVLANEMAGDKAFDFFKEVQRSFYFENADTGLSATYVKIAKQLDMDVADFEARFDSESAKAATKSGFEFSGSLGVNSFPTLVLKKGEEYHLVSRGYATSESILEAIGRILE